jgi:uncharacterized protein YndB with AHSA1/START domain
MALQSKDTKDRELIITREFNAPRELVFQAWTDPKHLINWWGPNGFTNTFHEVDIKPGGVWLFTMHGPDGVDYRNRIRFHEIIKPEFISYLHDSDDPNDTNKFNVFVSFEEIGKKKTSLTMRMVFATAEERKAVVEQYGAMEGAHQTLGRLAEELKKMI